MKTSIKKHLLCSSLILCASAPHSNAQQKLSKSGWQMNIAREGSLENIIFSNKGANDTIPFFKNANAGPNFYTSINGKTTTAQWIPSGEKNFVATIDRVECNMKYITYQNNPAIEITLTNKGFVPFQPQKAGIKLGIDTYMDKYPEWFGKYFPTLMRCEKTHFYGYLQTPSEHVLGVVSEQPIASWSVDYNLGYMDPAPHWFMGHRIESLNLDLLNALPLPEHNPQNLYQLLPDESKTWTISFVNIGDIANLEKATANLTGAPVFEIAQTTCVPGESINISIHSKQQPILKARFANGKEQNIDTSAKDGVYKATINAPCIGEVVLLAEANNKISEAIITVHQPWQWVMEKAREGCMKYDQKATSHAESWYGFYSAFIAGKYFPEKTIDAQATARFEYLFELLHDTTKMEPKYYASRIQNTSTTIGMLVDKFEAFGDINDIERASQLADWMIATSQRADGAYYNHGVIYTSVIYIAKSVLELAIIEKELGKTDAKWNEAYQCHYSSAKKAIDQLVASQGDFQTEGELTFEDGMISCSALQIGMFALLQEDEQAKAAYTQAMLDILNSHSCLTQLRVPDGRRRQGTMRFWEAQYDVQMLPNMFNSPHGWSAWRAYATYYAYLLTGEAKWLEQTYNAMGAFANLIDPQTGKLSWAFVIDPHLEVEQACSVDLNVTADSLSFGNPHPRLYETKKFVIGEQYIDMVSDWQTVNTQDNDVHEVFKCIGEAVLTNAFILEQPDGTIKGYNCKVERKGNQLHVTPTEKQITNLHCNLKKPYEVTFNSKSGKVKQTTKANMLDWLK